MGPNEPLDNLAWHALAGPHAHLGEGGGRAVRYHPDVAIFGALPHEPQADDWGALAEVVGPGEAATLFRDEVREPDGWERMLTIPARQMVATDVDGRLDPEAIDLGPADVEEMLGLVAATKPGPFGRRTVELGGYVGIRDDQGRLVAMAGHRLRAAGVVELSAVCTDERHRGRGLGTRLVRHVVARAAADGDTVVLHAASDNMGAIRLYEALGFTHRRAIEAAAVRAPGRPAVADTPVALDACAAADS